MACAFINAPPLMILKDGALQIQTKGRGTRLPDYSRLRPTGCHSERSEESLSHSHCHTQNHREILRFAQNDSKQGWRPQDPQWSALSSMPHP
jgi:hypothetical protein